MCYVSRAKKSDTIKPWLSARADCKEGRFIQVGNSFLLSEATQALTAGAFRTYMCMCMESGGRRDFQFPQKTAHKYGIADKTLRRHVDELVEKGFIVAYRNANLRKPNDYSFGMRWKPELKAPLKTL